MAADPRKRQKKLEKKAAKRKSKHEVIVKEKHASLAERLKEAARYPILHCRVMKSLWSQGMGQVFLSRELPNGSVAFAVFLVDRYCLGVKDAFYNIAGRFTYDARFRTKHQHLFEPTSPEAARKIVEGAVAYAQNLGLAPHPEYEKAALLFGDIDPAACPETFEFGKDGKPFFTSGPNDTPARCREVLHNLNTRLGPDGFHFMIRIDPGEKVIVPEFQQAQIEQAEEEMAPPTM